MLAEPDRGADISQLEALQRTRSASSLRTWEVSVLGRGWGAVSYQLFLALQSSYAGLDMPSIASHSPAVSRNGCATSPGVR